MAPTRPDLVSKESSHPALHPDVTAVPVTPGVHLSGKTAYSETATPGPSWSANSYFSNQQRIDDAGARAEKAAGAQSDADLDHKLSDTSNPASKPDMIDVDPRAAHPSLNLSGRIISATFAVPYSIGFSPGNDWELNPRRGTSALFDSFSYLASTSSPWNHTLVGWTGEIAPAKVAAAASVKMPVNKNAAPIPVDPKNYESTVPIERAWKSSLNVIMAARLCPSGSSMKWMKERTNTFSRIKITGEPMPSTSSIPCSTTSRMSQPMDVLHASHGQTTTA
jgi:trehalose 6-phosphate synthase/phosphatase